MYSERASPPRVLERVPVQRAPPPKPLSRSTRCSMKLPWLKEPHVAPRLLETSRMRLRPLKLTDAVRDYDAVMTSRAELWNSTGPGWPKETLTLEQNMIDLAWHEARRSSRGRGAAATLR